MFCIYTNAKLNNTAFDLKTKLTFSFKMLETKEWDFVSFL
jgi:hypothetical protein